MDVRKILGLLILLTSAASLAQPPEEVPPPPPDTTVEIPAAPAPVQSIPVAEPQPVMPAPSPAAADDPRLKGVTVSPHIAVLPVGYDSIDLTGDKEGGRYYFALAPGIALNTSLKTEKDRKLDFSLGYDFKWREYYNKETTTRDLTNDLSGSMAIEWTPLISTSVDALFEYFFKAGQDTSNDNNIYIEANPVAIFKLSDQLSFKAGYQLAYLSILNSKVGPEGILTATEGPSDADDASRGTFGSSSTGFDDYGDISQLAEQTESVLWNRAVLNTSYSPIKGTTVGLTYKWEFATQSNLDGNKVRGHFITPSISQDFPWKGGTISLRDEMRFRKYDYSTTDDSVPGSPPLQKFRNRLTLEANQVINEYLGVALYYRWETSGSNKDDYGVFDNNHQFYIGMNVSF